MNDEVTMSDEELMEYLGCESELEVASFGYDILKHIAQWHKDGYKFYIGIPTDKTKAFSEVEFEMIKGQFKKNKPEITTKNGVIHVKIDEDAPSGGVSL
jgi:hypothetical protein